MKKFTVLCLLATSVAFAAPAGSSEEASNQSLEVFDRLRGHAYNPYSTQGAAPTVGDLLLYPSDIYGKKFFYVSPTDSVGYVAFDFLGGSGLFGLDNSTPESGPKLAALLLGYATPSFGVALYYSVAKMWQSRKVPDPENANRTADASQRTTFPGDDIGLSFSLPLGSAKLYAIGDWLTEGQSWARDVAGTQDKLDVSTIFTRAGLAGTAGSLSYDANLFLWRTGATYTDPDGKKYTDSESSLTGGLGFDLGYAALQNSSARVLVGLNNVFAIEFTDEIKNSTEGDNVMALIISPNILAEVVLFENWLAFAGAMHNLTLAFGDGDGNDNSHQTILAHYDFNDPQNSGTRTFVGIRWQKTNWALEAQVSRNPFEALNGVNTFANFSGFIYF
jgi:hypothetical protein